MVSDLLSGVSPNSSDIIGENSRAVVLGKGRCNNWVPIIVANMNSESIYFIMRFLPTFNCFTSMIGWNFVNFLNER